MVWQSIRQISEYYRKIMQQPTSKFMCVQYVRPEHQPKNIAILVLDAQDHLLVRFTEDWSSFKEDDLDLITALTEDLRAKADEFEAAALYTYLQATLSNEFLISETKTMVSDNVDADLDRLEEELLKQPQHQVNSPINDPDTTGIRRILAATRKLTTTFRNVWLFDYGCAAASAACALLIIFSGVQLLREDKAAGPVSDTSRTSATKQAHQAPTNVTFDTALQMPLINGDYGACPTTQKTRPYKARRLGRRLALARIAPARTFNLPEDTRESPEVNLTAAADLDVTITPALAAVEEPSLPPPPEERVGGVRRVLQALAFPFKKFGASFVD
jgi:hypothetical protein